MITPSLISLFASIQSQKWGSKRVVKTNLNDDSLLDADLILATRFLYYSTRTSSSDTSTILMHPDDDDGEDDHDDNEENSTYSESWTGSSFISNESLINNGGLWISDKYATYDNDSMYSLSRSDDISIAQMMEITSNCTIHTCSQSAPPIILKRDE